MHVPAWLRVDLGGMFGGSTDAGAGADAGAAAQQFGALMGRMMPQLDVSTSISGLRLGEGKLALVAALVAGGLTYGEAAGHLHYDRRMLRLGAVAAAAVGLLAVLFSFTHAGEPLVTAIGIFVAPIAAATVAFQTFRRLQALPRVPAA